MKDHDSDREPEAGFSERCLVCNRSKKACFCGFVKPFDTGTRFVLLMHPKEFKRQKTGTGRLTRLALRNSEIIMGEDFSNEPRVAALLADPVWYPVLLYPGRESVNLSENGVLSVPAGKSLLVFVIDGTWRLAKKMMHLSTNLHDLPRVCFTPSEPSRFVIKQQPHEHCLSTIEAVHHLLAALELQGFERLENRHSTLLAALDRIVEFQRACAEDENLASYGYKKPYSPVRERRPSKKWQTRSYYFRG